MKANGKICPVCSSKTTILSEDEEYMTCLQCGVVRTKHNYDPIQYGTSYALNYIEYAKSPCNKSLNLFRLGLIARWLKSDAKVLDIGCCVGEFVRFAENYYECDGFEPNPVAAREANKRTRSNILSTLNGHKQYDCVTMFDVIEHIQEPAELLKHISSILNPGGIVALTTPDASVISRTGTVADEKFLKSWKHYKPKEHLFLYTEDSLEILLKNTGFSILHWGREESDIRPGNPNGDILTCVASKL